MINNRTRLLSFRVTDDELKRLKMNSTLAGARRLSDFIRQSVLDTNVAADGNAAQSALATLAEKIQVLEDRLNQLETKKVATCSSK